MRRRCAPTSAIRRGSTSFRSASQRITVRASSAVVGERGGFGSSAALAVAALVVSNRQEAGVGERTGELSDHGDADDIAVAVVRRRSRSTGSPPAAVFPAPRTLGRVRVAPRLKPVAGSSTGSSPGLL